MDDATDAALIARYTQILRDEARAVLAVAEVSDARPGPPVAACRLILAHCGQGKAGRLVTTGVGKAGIIARKIAATFASTGTPSLFLHPTEARHGDLGMVRAEDVLLAFSNSGASEEVVALVPSLRLIGCAIIALVGDGSSPLARLADVAIGYGQVIEACPLRLAPSTSTTVMMAIGDALALTVLDMRRFTPDQYARFHPGGALGRQLMTCSEVMRQGDRIAVGPPGTTVLEAMRMISKARAGSILLVDATGHLCGIFTDGDLRRRLVAATDHEALLMRPVEEIATIPCRSIRKDELVQAALHLCSERKINELPVVDEHGILVGLIDVQDLVDRGFAA